MARVTRTHDEARASYDRLSRWYDLISGKAERRCSEEGLLLFDPKPGEKVLEVGFGTGGALEWIARRTGGRAKLTGIDLSPGMRAVAQRRLERAAVTSVTLDTADACQMPYDAQTFDGVYTSLTLELFDGPEISVVLSECRRVLRPGGRFTVVSLSQPEAATLPVTLYGWAHRRLPRLVDCRPIPVRSLVESAGFRVRAQRSRSVWGLPVDIILAFRG